MDAEGNLFTTKLDNYPGDIKDPSHPDSVTFEGYEVEGYFIKAGPNFYDASGNEVEADDLPDWAKNELTPSGKAFGDGNLTPVPVPEFDGVDGPNFGGSGNDNLTGTDGNDVLVGAAGEDNLSGGDGDDILFGGDGNDALYGEAGNDVLIGGSGNVLAVTTDQQVIS